MGHNSATADYPQRGAGTQPLRNTMDGYKRISEENMKKAAAPKDHFRKTLERYLSIKGLDIVVKLADGKTVELYKNRSIENDEIVMFDASYGEKRIPLALVKSIDLYAA
jgi:hypothetical protein